MLQITKLNVQLDHCERDLRGQIAIAHTLENALSDSERNVRKTRLQMADMTKERDALQQQNEELRTQLDDATQASHEARQSLSNSQQNANERLAAERAARDAAKEQLERRIEEMRGRKSKFAVRCYAS